MQGAFSYVIWIVAGVGIVVAIVAAAGSGKVWREIGRDGMVRDTERSSDGGAGSQGFGGGVDGTGGTGGTRDDPTGGAGASERDIEIRQMLQARNDRRLRRGEQPLDIEAELRRLTAPAVDGELREEIRQLVVARNHRRARRGEPPLDVESEVERRVAELSSGYSRPTSS